MAQQFYTSLSVCLSITSWILWIKMFQTVCSERSLKISAILHQDAIIPCETRSSWIDLHNQEGKLSKNFERINLILWYRDGVSVPFYTVDARNLNEIMDIDHVRDNGPMDHTMLINPMVKHTNNGDDRIRFDLSKTTPLLRIKNVAEKDAGIYRCRVEYTSQRTFSTQIRLDVIGPPISLKITDQEGNQLEGVIGPYNEFENVTFICTVFGGNPKPSVIWFRQQSLYEEIVDDSYEAYTLENTINGTTMTVVNVLDLLRLDRNDYLAKYVCRASTKLYYPPLKASIIIDMNLMPVSVKVFMNQYHHNSPFRSLVAGVITEIGCRAEGSKPNAHIEWFLDDQRIVVATTTNDGHRSDHNCYEDNDETVNNDNDEESMKMDDDPINCANNSPSPSLKPYRCKFLSIIETHKADNTVSIIRFIPNYTDNNRLLSCHAYNPFIGDPSKKITDKISLNIQYGPIVSVGISIPLDHNLHGGSVNHENRGFLNLNEMKETKSRQKNVTIVEQTPLLELNCYVKANPWVDQVLWYQNGTLVDRTTSLSSIDSSTSAMQVDQTASMLRSALYMVNHNQTLRIENIKRSHSGHYHCKAFNSINDSCSEVIKLNVAYAPECLYNATKFLHYHRNKPMMLDCPVDSVPSDNNVYRWKLSLMKTGINSTSANDENVRVVDNDTFGYIFVDNGPALEVLMVLDRLLHPLDDINQPSDMDDDENGDSNDGDFQSSHTLLIQCEASNLVGGQKAPCSYLIHIYPGPPQKVKNCTFHLENENASDLDDTNEQENPQENEISMNGRKVSVGCQPGNNGGRKQSLHLIGSLSNDIWQKFWQESSLEMNSSQIQSLIKTIESKYKKSDDEDGSDEQIETIKNVRIFWNKVVVDVPNDADQDRTDRMVWFQLTNFSLNQSYDMIVFAKNSIGISEPLMFFNLVMEDEKTTLEHENNQELNVKQTRSVQSKNWAYLRFKGLIVVSVFLLVIALTVAMIRNFVSTASSNDTLGAHSLETSNQKQRQQQWQRQQQKTNQEELIPVARTKPTTTTAIRNDANQSEPNQILHNDVDDDDEHRNHDVNESGMETYYSAENDQTSHPKDIDSLDTMVDVAMADILSIDDASTINSNNMADAVILIGNIIAQNTIVPLKNGFWTAKRFLNRSIRSTSHYGTYNLPTCSDNEKFTNSPDATSSVQDGHNYAGDDHNKWIDCQEELELSLVPDISNGTISDSSSSRSSNSSDSSQNIAATSNIDVEFSKELNQIDCSNKNGWRSLVGGGGGGGGGSGKLENLFNRFRPNTWDRRPSTMATATNNTTNQNKSTKKKYVKNSNRYGGQKHSSLEDQENNVELVYVFQKDLY